MDCKAKLEMYLRENGVPYQLHHIPTAYTAQDVAASEHVPGTMVAKVVMALADGELVMLVLPAPQHVDLRKLKGVTGAGDVAVADERDFATAFPDCDLGAMPPFGNLYGVPVFVEQALTEDEQIICKAGTHTDTIRLKYADFARLVAPRVARFAL